MSKKEYGKIEVKTDCFAYKKTRVIETCKVLRCLYCRKEKCGFYKNVEEYKEGLEKYGTEKS